MFSRKAKIILPVISETQVDVWGKLSRIVFADGAMVTRNPLNDMWEGSDWTYVPMTTNHWTVVWNTVPAVI